MGFAAGYRIGLRGEQQALSIFPPSCEALRSAWCSYNQPRRKHPPNQKGNPMESSWIRRMTELRETNCRKSICVALLLLPLLAAAEPSISSDLPRAKPE